MSAFAIRQPSVEALNDAPCYFRYGANKRRMMVDGLTANAVLLVYRAITNPEQKAKFECMVSGSPEQFLRVVDFCWKRVKL